MKMSHLKSNAKLSSLKEGIIHTAALLGVHQIDLKLTNQERMRRKKSSSISHKTQKATLLLRAIESCCIVTS